MPVGAEGQPEPSKAALQSYADHIGAHQTRAGFLVIDVWAPFRLKSTETSPTSARLTEWTVVPGSPGSASMPNMVGIIPGSCTGTGMAGGLGIKTLTSGSGT